MPGSKVTSPIAAATPLRIALDAGALYRDWNEASEVRVGATRGGAVFTLDREDRDIEVDGAKGSIKDLVRTVREDVMLAVTLVEVSLEQLLRLTRGTEVSDGEYNLITPTLSPASSDFLTNIALVASVQGTSDPMVITLLNALERGQWTFTTQDRNEGGLAVTFRAHYAPTAVTTPPYALRWPVGAS